MQNANVMSRVAMSPAERLMGTGRTRSESVTIAPHAEPDRLAARGPMRCRWRAAADGTLRMQWLKIPAPEQ
jgi:hypothetical protein